MSPSSTPLILSAITVRYYKNYAVNKLVRDFSESSVDIILSVPLQRNTAISSTAANIASELLFPLDPVLQSANSLPSPTPRIPVPSELFQPPSLPISGNLDADASANVHDRDNPFNFTGLDNTAPHAAQLLMPNSPSTNLILSPTNPYTPLMTSAQLPMHDASDHAISSPSPFFPSSPSLGLLSSDITTRTTPSTPSTPVQANEKNRSPASSRRVRATKMNSLHGNVVGAMRGKDAFEILRTRPLPLARTTDKESSRRFRIIMADLISRAERLSAETNCWLFMAGQSRSAASANNFYHYASPALVEDAYDQTNQLINLFGGTVEALVTLRKEEVVQLNLRFNELSKGKEEAEKQTREAQKELARVHDEHTILSRLLARIKSGEIGVEDIPDVDVPST
ncbi:hypothetical protein H0H92_001294 [Tricholoma furcatifolium]|nr:hypothetical protein H0H92_001294 [Tricholoma furcatifolium]